MLISDPSGFSMQLSTDLLNQTPFDNYMVPGIILLVAVGFMSIMVAILAIRMSTKYPLWIVLMGIILFIWLTAEIILNVEFYYPLYHIPMYTISLLLAVVGAKLRKLV